MLPPFQRHSQRNDSINHAQAPHYAPPYGVIREVTNEYPNEPTPMDGDDLAAEAEMFLIELGGYDGSIRR